MKKTFYTILLLLLAYTLMPGQTITPIAFNLAAPIDVCLDSDGNPWITQSGTGMNDGVVQKIRPDGSKETIIAGLPSFFNAAAKELQGALSTLVLSDGRILLCQGEGIDSLSSSILVFHWDDYLAKGAPLTPGDQRSAISLHAFAKSKGFEKSNPYSMVVDANGNFLIADAGANAIFKYLVGTQELELLAALPSFPNPSPVGPPFVQSVPTKILAHPGGGYLVSTLTGFPFLDGAANIFRLMDDGSLTVHASGMTLLTDMDFDPSDGGLLALQFARFGPVDTTFGFIFGSAQLVKVHPDGSLDTLLAGFGPSPGLAIAADGTAYMTHLFLGQLLKTDVLTGLLDFRLPQFKPLTVLPNPNDGRFSATLLVEKPGKANYQLTNLLGREVACGSTGILPEGENQLLLDFSNRPIANGTYLLTLRTDKGNYVSKVIFR